MKKSIIQKMKNDFGKGLKMGFEKTSKKDLPSALDLRSTEDRLKSLEEGKIGFFSEVEIPALKCSEKYSEWVLLGLPKEFKIVAVGHVFTNKGYYIKKEVLK